MKALEIFSCSGGMAEGFRRSGGRFDWVFDKDPDACASYERNLGHRPIRMDVRDLLRMVDGGWSPGALDIIVADPPCTPWSRAGKRLGEKDERDMFADTCQLIELLRPRAYLIGNVPGLEDSTNWGTVQRRLAPLRRAGYCVADFTTLDAADYGVPQHRVRPFWFGHLSGACIRWPLPTHGPPTKDGLPGLALRPWVTCQDALQHLPVTKLGRPVRLRTQHARHPPSTPITPSRTIVTKGDRQCGGSAVLVADLHGGSDPREGQVMRAADPNRPPASAAEVHRTVTSASKDQALLEWPWSAPATTVTAGDRLGPPGHLSGPNAVLLSELAVTILQGFPEDWHFAGKTKRSRWSQLGQAMPPPLAEAVARSVMEQLERTTSAMEESA